MAARWMPAGWKRSSLRLQTDTTEFFNIAYGDVVQLNGRHYLIRNSAKEGRFGLDDEIKHWVKRSIDLEQGEMCILKLVFYEKFVASVGDIEFECFRSPRKEARILDLVKDHPNFMHGFSAPDEKGNTVRVIEYIHGKALAQYIEDLPGDHESYFFETLPAILRHYLECLEAVRFLHEHNEKHGDIRRDHILIDSNSGRFRWIDFDYNFRHRENIYGYDLFGLGNVLVFIVGKGDVLLHHLKRHDPDALSRLVSSDLNIVFRNRVANLKKIYGYIPDSLNRVLMYFSGGARLFYEHVEQMINDLRAAIADIG